MIEVMIGNKICNFISLYRFPGQTKDEFATFIKDLENNLEHIVDRSPVLIVVLGDFIMKILIQETDSRNRLIFRHRFD